MRDALCKIASLLSVRGSSLQDRAVVGYHADTDDQSIRFARLALEEGRSFVAKLTEQLDALERSLSERDAEEHPEEAHAET